MSENVWINRVLSIFKDIDKIFVFGAGNYGKDLKILLSKYGLFDSYIDNDIEKQRNGFCNENVISLNECLKKANNNYIVIAASSENSINISEQLQNSGLILYEDYCTMDYFLKKIFPVISYYKYNKLYTNLVQITLTERCTLKCKKCAHACWNVPINVKDMSFETAKESADYFFSKYDFVNEFVLIGGEPFLYKYLKDIIQYIGEKYRNKINIFSLTTNGTIIPEAEIISLFHRYNITLRVSDYSQTLPYLADRYRELYDKFQNNDVRIWKTNNKNAWFDYGFGEFDRHNDIHNLKKAFSECSTECREVRGNKYYYCVMARTVSDNMNLNLGQDDYIDLNSVKDKRELLQFELGNIDKGYLEMCNYCRGAEAKKYLIPAAEQRSKNE
jgi:hypothetical protein